MTSPEVRAQIRRYFYAEHWKIGTIARELGVHPDAVRNAIESEKFKSSQPLRASVVDPYLGFVQQTLDDTQTYLTRRVADKATHWQHVLDAEFDTAHHNHQVLRDRMLSLQARQSDDAANFTAIRQQMATIAETAVSLVSPAAVQHNSKLYAEVFQRDLDPMPDTHRNTDFLGPPNIPQFVRPVSVLRSTPLVCITAARQSAQPTGA